MQIWGSILLCICKHCGLIYRSYKIHMQYQMITAFMGRLNITDIWPALIRGPPPPLSELFSPEKRLATQAISFVCG